MDRLEHISLEESGLKKEINAIDFQEVILIMNSILKTHNLDEIMPKIFHWLENMFSYKVDDFQENTMMRNGN